MRQGLGVCLKSATDTIFGGSLNGTLIICSGSPSQDHPHCEHFFLGIGGYVAIISFIRSCPHIGHVSITVIKFTFISVRSRPQPRPKCSDSRRAHGHSGCTVVNPTVRIYRQKIHFFSSFREVYAIDVNTHLSLLLVYRDDGGSD